MKPVILFIPTKNDVASLKVGDMALDCFGRWKRVIEVQYRGTSVQGHDYVGFCTEFGPTSTMSHGYKVGELCRTVHASGRFKSAELDDIEREMNSHEERLREV